MKNAGKPLAGIEDVRRALGEDARLATWRLPSHGPPGPAGAWNEHARADALPVEQTGAGMAHGPGRVPARVLILGPAAWQDPVACDGHLCRAREAHAGVIFLGTDAAFAAAGLALDRLDAPHVVLVPLPVPAARLHQALHNAAALGRMHGSSAAMDLALGRARYENEMLISIGRALSQQRDLRSLLELILRRAREVTGADAGSIYVVEGDDGAQERRTLRFMVSQNDSIEVESKGFTMKVSESSIVGLCVLSGEDINIPDLYALDPPGTGNNPWGFVHDRSFDDKYGYQTRSMLTVPMISARQQVIGVIQLINKRREDDATRCAPRDFEREVVSFDGVSVDYAKSLASQAGIALENAMLYDEVKTLFEGFVRASVTAIEARDPTTSGHSERVARLTTGLAKVADRVDRGVYADLRFSDDDITQIEYAALLHDFGKVGVREHVLIKAKKLYPVQREMMLQRFHYIRKTIENECLQSKVDYLLAASRDRMLAEAEQRLGAELAAFDAAAAARLVELDEFVRFILTANEPSVLEQGGFERIAGIAALRYVDGDGAEQPYLSEQEVIALQVLRGSLTPEERSEIESHVVHTSNFLRKIPWGRTFRQIPEIAGAHHEKLDGSGYPDGLRGDAIPIPARMMTISDIYDALTAADRPYKKAVPVDRALDILGMEVESKRLDRELFRLFVDAKVYELTGA